MTLVMTLDIMACILKIMIQDRNCKASYSIMVCENQSIALKFCTHSVLSHEALLAVL